MFNATCFISVTKQWIKIVKFKVMKWILIIIKSLTSYLIMLTQFHFEEYITFIQFKNLIEQQIIKKKCFMIEK